MFKIIVFALAVGIASANPLPDPLAPAIPGAVTTTHHTSTAAHHPVGLGGYGMGMGYGYPGVVKHTETVSSAGYPAAALNPYAAYGAYPGLAGLGFGAYGGYPAAKQVTQVTTTAMRPGLYGYY